MATQAVAGTLGIDAAKKLSGLKLGVNPGTAITSLFALMELKNVPKALGLKYDRDCKPVEGTNWKAGGKEVLNAVPRAAVWLLLPKLITKGAACFGPAGATAAALLAFAIPMIIPSHELFPSEAEEIENACKAKGINLQG